MGIHVVEVALRQCYGTAAFSANAALIRGKTIQNDAGTFACLWMQRYTSLSLLIPRSQRCLLLPQFLCDLLVRLSSSAFTSRRYVSSSLLIPIPHFLFCVFILHPSSHILPCFSRTLIVFSSLLPHSPRFQMFRVDIFSILTC
jgi:hypothetical protein